MGKAADQATPSSDPFSTHGRLRRSFRLAWFCEHREALPAEIRITLMQAMVAQAGQLVVPSIAALGLCALCISVLPGARWPWWWMASEIALLIVRLPVIAWARRALGRADCRPFYLSAALGTTWCAMLGAFGACCMMTGNGMLAAVAGINIAGVAAGISTRSAGFPRLALVQDMLVGLPFAIAASFAPARGFGVLSVEIPLGIAGMASVTRSHFAALVRLIRAERQNHFLTLHDGLTGLPNRRYLHERMDEMLNVDDGERAASGAVVLCLDLDGFKCVNDTHGHAAGDELLQAVSGRLRRAVRETDTVVRVGGDEFVVLLPGADGCEAERIAERILTTVSQPYVEGFAFAVRVGISIGSAMWPADGWSADELLARADAALYAAKRNGRGTHVRWAQLAQVEADRSAASV